MYSQNEIVPILTFFCILSIRYPVLHCTSLKRTKVILLPQNDICSALSIELFLCFRCFFPPSLRPSIPTVKLFTEYKSQQKSTNTQPRLQIFHFIFRIKVAIYLCQNLLKSFYFPPTANNWY